MKLDALKKPKTTGTAVQTEYKESIAKKPAKKKRVSVSPTKKAAVTEPNLHQVERNTKRKKEFSLPDEIVRDFEVVASTRGFGPRKHSDFFMEVWQFWKSNHTD